MNLQPKARQVQVRSTNAHTKRIRTLCPRCKVSAEHSDIPIWSNLPSSLSFARVLTVSSTDTLESRRAHSNKSRRFVPLSFSFMRLTLLARFSGLGNKKKKLQLQRRGFVLHDPSTHELSASADMDFRPPFLIRIGSHQFFMKERLGESNDQRTLIDKNALSA